MATAKASHANLFIAAVMRIVELSGGRILIDGTDTSLIGLAKLRRNLAVIPQDPVLFSGTLRSNLDPFNEFRDEQLYETLEKVGLYKGNGGIGGSTHSLASLSKHRIESLDDHVAEGGSNFSVGQRQLVVIGRALLRGARIVVIDEATASVDSETDAAIQVVMRKEFTSATCITVAHRINTILDSDFILVMDDGRVAEFDEPTKLLRKGGLFRDLVKASSHDQL
jgi:ABC-type multidrug transport system fused ATPase/permease subunit